MDKNTLIVAFSGGPDSVYLSEYLQERGYTIILAHFNHHMQIREGDNDEDEEFVKNYADKNNYKFEIGHWKTPENSEEKARIARYTFLEEVRQKNNAQWICTGHHLNDNAETIILQYLRGGGIRSLTGVTEKDETRKLWRPLLGITKKEILEDLKKKNIKYQIDSSNNESIFTRNFLRNDIFPELEKRFPNFQTRIHKQSRHFRELQKYLETQAKGFIDSHNINSIPIHDFLSLPSPLRFEVLKQLIHGKYIDNNFCETIYQFLENAKSGEKTGKRLETKYQVMKIKKKFFSIEEKNDIIQ